MNKKEIIESNQESPKEISKTYTLFYSFFLIPLMIAFLAAFFFAIFNLITYEKTTVFDLLNHIETGGETKRWQSAYTLQSKVSEIKSLPINQSNEFKRRLIELYENSKSDLDHCKPETRLYLAKLMGVLDDPYYIEPLLDGLNDQCKCDPNADITQEYSSRIHAITSIGQLVKNSPNKFLKDKVSNIILNQIEKYYSNKFSSESLIALHSIIALGEIGFPGGDFLAIGRPNWDKNDNCLFSEDSLKYKGLITGKILSEGEVTQDDMIAAFLDDGSLCGFACMSNLDDVNIFKLHVFSSVKDEKLRFKYYNSSEDIIYNLNESFDFENSMLITDTSEPFNFTYESAKYKNMLTDILGGKYDE